MATKHTFTKREQKWIEESQCEFNRYMKEWCESDKVITFWTDFTECEMKHFSKIILDVDDLYEEEIEECESPKNVKKAQKELTKVHNKLMEANKEDLPKLTDLVTVFLRKMEQHDELDNGIPALVGFYDSLIESTATFILDYLENYSDEDIDEFEEVSGYGVR